VFYDYISADMLSPANAMPSCISASRVLVMDEVVDSAKEEDKPHFTVITAELVAPNFDTQLPVAIPYFLCMTDREVVLS